MKRWSFAASSVRGTSHVKAGTRIQDAKRCLEVPLPGIASVFCGIVADGAGSAQMGGEGASLVCRTIAELVRTHLIDGPQTLPEDDDIWTWLDETRDRLFAAASKRNLPPRQFASTMIAVLSNGAETVAAHMGDGAVVARGVDDGQWFVLSEPENGEYASTTYFVTDSGTPRLRISRSPKPVDALFVFSDGIEHQVLDGQSGEPYTNFFNPMIKPFLSSAATGRDHFLSERLAAYLASEKFDEHTDDDKTLIIAARK